MILKLPASILSCLVLLISLAASAAAQPKRQTPAKTPPPPAATPVATPPPTLDTLLAADTYRVYGEVRSVGQFIKSNSVNEILEPILKLAAPPKEFRTVVKWLNTHADEVMSSRLIFATWPSQKGLPDAVVAIEFASPEEANKFQQQLNPFLKKMMETTTPTPAGEPNKSEAPAPPPYHIQQAGSLILITPTPLNLKKLRPAGSKLLAEDPNFRVAHNRLNTESLFLFFDVASAEKEEQERIAKAEEEYKKAAAERAANPEPPEPPKVELATDPDETELPDATKREIVGVVDDSKGATSDSPPMAVSSPPPIVFALSMIMSSFTNVEAKWPAAVGVGLSLDGESFDLRALLVSKPGEKSDPIPFLPVLAPGPAITPEAPNILPGDTETLITMSLDLPQIYASLSQPRPIFADRPGPQFKVEQTGEMEQPFAALEKELKIKIKDDLLPLIGPEIAVSIPMTGMDWFQPPQPPKTEPPATSQPSPSPSPDANASDEFKLTETTKGPAQDNPSLAILISLKDKEGMRALLPKLIENVAFKGASALAATERREDTELVSYANVVAYAFIGNFLVISPDVATTRHVVDSYLKHQTLSGEPHFKNYTRWQPRQVQGQFYLSPSLMESYRKWIQQPDSQVDDQTRAFLTRFSVVAQPVTYSLSNEGFGPMHELHIPKNLVLFMIAAASGINPVPAELQKETAPTPPPPPPPARPVNPF